MWGADWDLPTLLANCEKAGVLGVELRTTHAHGVEPSMSADERREVKQRFADSPVMLVGLGSNEDFHDADAQSLKTSIDRAKDFIKLSHDVGGSGVKVKPNDLPKEVPQEQTIEQIGKALNELGAFAAELRATGTLGGPRPMCSTPDHGIHHASGRSPERGRLLE